MYRIVAIGDGLTRGSPRNAAGGFTAPVHPSWRYYLHRLLRDAGVDHTYVGSQTTPDFPADQFDFPQANEARGGNTTTAAVAAGIEGWSAGYTPDVAVVLLGREDAYQQVSVATRIANLERIIDLLRRRNPAVTIALCETPPTLDGANGTYRTRTQIAPANALLPALRDRKTTATSPVLLVPLTQGFVQAHTSNGRDLTAAGDEWIAQKIWAVLEDALEAGGGEGEPTDETGTPTSTGTNPDIQPRFAVSRRRGPAPLTVRFLDRSVVNSKARHYRVVLVGVPEAFWTEASAYIPGNVFVCDEVRTGVLDTDYYVLEDTWDGIERRVPVPIDPDTVVLCRRDGWTFGDYAGFAATVGRVSVAVTASDISAGNHAPNGIVVWHELLHTIDGLESPDAASLRASTGFLAWMREHQPDHAFGDNQAIAIEPELEELFYHYLTDLYKTDPTFNGGQVAYLWDHDDGTTSDELDHDHAYAANGYYSPSLTITNPGGHQTVTYPDLIAVGDGLPEADFAVSPADGPAPLAVQFTDRSEGAPTAWLWTFGDGATSTEQSPAHVYTTPGAYPVSLTVTNATGEHTRTVAAAVFVQGEGVRPTEIAPLTDAGYIRLLQVLTAEYRYAALVGTDGAELAIPRVPLGTLAWTVCGCAVAKATATIAGYSGAPITVAGFNLYAAATGGSALGGDRWDPGTGGHPVLQRPADTIEVPLELWITRPVATPRIAGLVVDPDRVRSGEPTAVRLLVEGIEGRWRVSAIRVDPRARSGELVALQVQLEPVD